MSELLQKIVLSKVFSAYKNHLFVVDGSLQSILCHESVDVAWFGLPVPVDSTDCLRVMAWVPRHIHYYHPENIIQSRRLEPR